MKEKTPLLHILWCGFRCIIKASAEVFYFLKWEITSFSKTSRFSQCSIVSTALHCLLPNKFLFYAYNYFEYNIDSYLSPMANVIATHVFFLYCAMNCHKLLLLWILIISVFILLSVTNKWLSYCYTLNVSVLNTNCCAYVKLVNLAFVIYSNKWVFKVKAYNKPVK